MAVHNHKVTLSNVLNFGATSLWFVSPTLFGTCTDATTLGIPLTAVENQGAGEVEVTIPGTIYAEPIIYIYHVNTITGCPSGCAVHSLTPLCNYNVLLKSRIGSVTNNISVENVSGTYSNLDARYKLIKYECGTWQNATHFTTNYATGVEGHIQTPAFGGWTFQEIVFDVHHANQTTTQETLDLSSFTWKTVPVTGSDATYAFNLRSEINSWVFNQPWNDQTKATHDINLTTLGSGVLTTMKFSFLCNHQPGSNVWVGINSVKINNMTETSIDYRLIPKNFQIDNTVPTTCNNLHYITDLLPNRDSVLNEPSCTFINVALNNGSSALEVYNYNPSSTIMVTCLGQC